MTTTTSENTPGIRPLTSVFTIPTSGCDTAILTDYAYTSSLTSCAPPAYSENVRNWGYYSPGICPLGYTSGCTPWNESRTKKATESWAACVPISYTCDTTQSFRYAISVSGTSTISRPFIAIRWASSDLSILETNPTSPSAAARQTSTGTTTTSRSPTQTSNDNNDTGGGGGGSSLSGGAIAGIVIGSIAAIALIAAAGFLIYRYRKKRIPSTTPSPSAAYSIPPGQAGAPPPGAPYYPQQPGQQLYPSPGPGYPPGQHPQGMYMQPGMQQIQQLPMAYHPGTDPSRPYSTMTSVSGTTAGAPPPGGLYNAAAGGNGYEAPKYAGWPQGGSPPAELPSGKLAEPAAEMPAQPVQAPQEVPALQAQGQPQYQGYSPPPGQGGVAPAPGHQR